MTISSTSPVRRRSRRLMRPIRRRLRRSRAFWWSAGKAAWALAGIARSDRWLWRVGVANERLGRLPEALLVYGKVVAKTDVAMPLYFKVASLYEQRGESEPAEKVLQMALDRAPSAAEYHVRLARIRGRASDWAAASNEYRAALRLEGERPDWLAALARALRRIDDYHGSVEAYQRALAVTTEEAPSLRFEFAKLHDQMGSWAEASALLQANIAAYPLHAASHRLLALVSEKTWRWGGTFERGTWTPRDVGDAHVLARRAMATAVRLRDDRPSWLVDLGRITADARDHDASRTAFGRSHEMAAQSTSRRLQSSIHPAQFGLELAHHRSGKPRVTDPLFGVRIEVPTDGGVPGDSAGVFDAQVEHDGFRIKGLLSHEAAERVEIWLDDVLLRQVNLNEGGYLASFQFRLRRSALSLFPQRSTLTVRTQDGDFLLARGRAPHLQLSIPTGTGEIGAAIRAGRVLDKKGVLAPSEQDLHQLQDEFIKLYTEVHEFLEREFGKQLLLFYGNLLGLHRDGGFIPGDDDFDVGYVSDETDPVSVKAEAIQVIVALMRAGFTISVNRKGALFRVQREGEHVHLSVRQAWFSDGKAWILRYANFPARREDFLPAQEAVLRGVKVLIPAEPEVFLAGHYGPGWRYPDPGFRYYSANVSPRSLSYLQKARMSPTEFKELQATMSAERETNPGVGRLVALGSQSLYPLESYVE